MTDRDDTPVSDPGQMIIAEELPADPRAVRQARELVAGLATTHRVTCERLDDIRLAVSEAVTNVVRHAYHGGAGGAFRLLAIVGGRELVVVIDDDGAGLSADATDPGLGMGLDLMKRVSDAALFLSREAGGSTIQLRFCLEPQTATDHNSASLA